jgi:hypothetical protein
MDYTFLTSGSGEDDVVDAVAITSKIGSIGSDAEVVVVAPLLYQSAPPPFSGPWHAPPMASPPTHHPSTFSLSRTSGSNQFANPT